MRENHHPDSVRLLIGSGCQPEPLFFVYWDRVT